ncbi:MAG TPA: AAA family ATPase [Chloroflexota bacterium]|nr:AAA family ATPase [Chloroflexota bacterium]
MLISRFKIENYKSFLSSEEITLSSGFNVIVGENNSGKTALVEALSLRFEKKPHQSIKTVPYSGARIPTNSQVSISFEFGRTELENYLLDYDRSFHLLIGDEITEEIAQEAFFRWFEHDRKVNCIFHSGGLDSAHLEHQAYEHRSIGPKGRALVYNFDRSMPNPNLEGVGVRNIGDSMPRKLVQHFQERIYTFRAERLHVGQCAFGSSNQLSPDAANLPEVLNYLQSRQLEFENFNSLVRLVFPQIARISVRPILDNLLKIHVLTQANGDREDLAMPLQDSGTGIGQVLAILYVALTAPFPRAILIDEPQSFLHPGAIRRLFDVLREFPQHQYIVTTHSPIVITSANPKTVLLVRKEGSESIIESIDQSEKIKLEKILRDVGAKLSDVFGADNILWVEGPTEEISFPLILTGIMNVSLWGTAVVGVVNTGDLEGRHSNRVLEIYNKLSQGNGLLPPALGFVFDKEGRTQSEQDDLIRRSLDQNEDPTVFFTPRRMYENYLLNPAAIAAIMSEIDGLSDRPITESAITQWIQDNKWDSKYFGRHSPKDQTNQTEETWLEKVHGAKVLQDIFHHFSGGRGFEYDKKVHGLALTKWLIENSPDDLKEIADLLKVALGRNCDERG